MKKKIFLYLIFLTLTFPLRAQDELLIEHATFGQPLTAATIGNQTLFSAHNVVFSSNIFGQLTDTNNALYLITHKLELLDTLEIDKYLNIPNASINSIINVEDSLYAVGVSDWQTTTFWDYDNVLLLFDKKLNEVARYRSKGNNGNIVMSAMNLIEDKIYISLRIRDTGFFAMPQIEVYDLHLDSVVFKKSYTDTSSPHFTGRDQFRSLYPWNNGFFASYVGTENFNVGYVLDSNLNVIENLQSTDPRLAQNTPPAFYGGLLLRPDELIHATKNKFYFTGMFNREYMVLSKLDASFNHIHTDTFAFPESNNLFNLMQNFPLGHTAYNSLDSIFIFNNDDNVNCLDILDNDLDDVDYQDMLVVNFDTSGNLNWRKIIHQDSAIFFAREMEPTQDGGVLLFSAKYDKTYDPIPHMRLSIIKLDRFGNVISEREFKAPEPAWSVYPNPISADFTLEGLPEDEAVQLQLLSINGQIVWQQEGKTRQWQLPSNIEKGVYLLKLTNAQGQPIGMRKVVVQGE